MNPNLAVGKKVKQLRTKKKLTLKQLSELTGLSTGFLSQLERGISTIAIDSLAKVAGALDVELSSFFKHDSLPGAEPVMRGFEQKYSQVSPRIIESVMSKDMLKYDVLPRLFQLMPSEDSDEPPAVMYSHHGEEFVYVLEGVLTLYMNHKEYTLYPGDSAQVHSDDEHNWANRTNRMVQFIQLNYPNPYLQEYSEDAAAE